MLLAGSPQIPSLISMYTAGITQHSYEQQIADKYKISSRVLGKGTKSIVKLGYSTALERNVAIKVIEKSRISEENELFNIESKILDKVRQLNSKQYVNYLETLEDERNIFIITELINGVELIDFYSSSKGKVPEGLTKKIFKQVVQSVEKLHNNHICHLDLKLENIMYIRYLNQTILIDFGFANTTIDCLNDQQTAGPIDLLQTHYCGTLHYSAPEILKQIPFDGKKADAWSLGVMLYCMLTLIYPFDLDYEMDDFQFSTTTSTISSPSPSSSYFTSLSQKIINDQLNYDNITSTEAKSLLKSLLTKDPSDRLFVHEILSHPYLL